MVWRRCDGGASSSQEIENVESQDYRGSKASLGNYYFRKVYRFDGEHVRGYLLGILCTLQISNNSGVIEVFQISEYCSKSHSNNYTSYK